MLRGWNKVGARPSARRAVLLVSVVLVSAGGLFASPSINRSARTTRGPMFSRDPRPTTPPKRIPSVIAPLLPKRGVYAAGGGSSASAWRVVLDLDASVIVAGKSSRPGAKSFGVMTTTIRTKLTKNDLTRLVRLADRAWREKRTIPANPSTHYGELLVFVDGDVRYMLDGFGPFRPGSAATLLLDALRAAGRIPR